jgi:hypothetical protein
MNDHRDSSSAGFIGTPSDAVPQILAEGRGGITTLFVSMAQRHPDGGRCALPAMAHPGSPAGATPPRQRARVPARCVDAGVPRGAGGERRALRGDRPSHDLFLRRYRRARRIQQALQGTLERRPGSVRAPTGAARRLRRGDPDRGAASEGRLGRAAVVPGEGGIPAHRRGCGICDSIDGCARRRGPVVCQFRSN